MLTWNPTRDEVLPCCCRKPSPSSSLSADLGWKDLTLKDGEAAYQKVFMLLLEEGEIIHLGRQLSSHCTSTGWWPGPPVLPPLGWEQGVRITPSCILESTEMDFSLNCLLSDSAAHLFPDCIIFLQASLDSVVIFCLAPGFCCPFCADYLKLDPFALLLFGTPVLKIEALALLLNSLFFMVSAE